MALFVEYLIFQLIFQLPYSYVSHVNIYAPTVSGHPKKMKQREMLIMGNLGRRFL